MFPKTLVASCLFVLLTVSLSAQRKTVEQRIDSVMALMTLEEKVGQMNQYSGVWAQTGPITTDGDIIPQIKAGKVGSMLNVTGIQHTIELQEMALRSRLKIPLLFGQDVIHGYRTTFPIPLGEAASWDMEAIEKAARIAATEATADGIHWTFAPMVDVSRDPRWGRVMEGAGEDPYLGSLIAAARVKGFQGKGLGKTDALMACVKHFAAYGAAVGGRDYNSVDMSDYQLWNVYLPPFKAAAEAGAATFMNAFNDLNGIPASASTYLQRDILKGQWKFKGFVVSDWGSIGEMIQHGYVKDNYEAAWKAALAGSDMDMESRSYIKHLPKLVKEGKVPPAVVDDAVRRILRKKFELGLFDDPYRFSKTERQSLLHNPEHVAFGREMARKSIVLLKNDKHVLPLAKKGKKIAVIGPMAKSERNMMGFWAIDWPDSSYIVSPYEGIESAIGNGNTLLYAKGCDVMDTSHAGFDEAIATALQADVVVLSMGEKRDLSGEAKSRADITFPGVQEELIKAIHATGKPIVLLVHAGRPLIFNWAADNVDAILYTWWLGSEAGNAIADVLFGDYNPAGKLPMSFPRNVGQVPIYYNHFNTGRPALNDSDRFYRSAYIDESLYPRYPFGFGLSYTSFSYSGLSLSRKSMRERDSIVLTFQLTNSGKVAGEEVAQLYIRDKVASSVRPVKELRGFQKVMLLPGESKTLRFVIDRNTLGYYNRQLNWVAEPGEFDIMIGSSSADTRLHDMIVVTR